MDELIGFLIACAVCAPPILFFVHHGRQRSEMERGLRSIPDFKPVLRMNQPDHKTVLALDPNSGLFAIGRLGQPVHAFSFAQLVAVEAEKDGATVERTNRGSQMMGAAVGGALLGPVGLLIGGLSGSKRHDAKVKQLSLKLYTDDMHSPVSEIVFFKSGAGLPSDSAPVKNAAALLDQWHARFLTILQSQSRASSGPVPTQPAAPTTGFGQRRALVPGR